MAGYTGTISKVSVKENGKVSGGTTLFKLTDLPNTSEYEKLVAERSEVADALSQIVALYNNPNLYADFSGTIQSVNCEDAEYVEIETETDSAESDAAETKENAEKTESSETPEKADTSTEEGNRQTSTGSVSGGVIGLGMTAVSGGDGQSRGGADLSDDGSV